MAWDNSDYYYSGQGIVLMGTRDSSGNPAGLRPIGNVSELKLSIATSVIEHKESKTGNRAIDLRLTTETKASLSVRIEHFDSRSLALAMRGDFATMSAASIVAEANKGYWGAVTPLTYMNVSAVSVKRGATVLTAYTNDATPYDYKVNASGGSYMLNDGSTTPQTANATAGGVVPTAVTVGTTTSITVANTAVVGDRVALSGFAGADAAVLNAKAHVVVTASPTAITVATNTTGKTITVGTPLAVFDGGALTVDYSYATQNVVQGMTQGSQERWIRFEGLNTADGNNPVVVDIFRFLTDPLKELSFIGDTINNFELQGNMLADNGRSTGSKFFRQMMVR
jgi:hypothetical protein